MIVNVMGHAATEIQDELCLLSIIITSSDSIHSLRDCWLIYKQADNEHRVRTHVVMRIRLIAYARSSWLTSLISRTMHSFTTHTRTA